MGIKNKKQAEEWGPYRRRQNTNTKQRESGKPKKVLDPATKDITKGRRQNEEKRRKGTDETKESRREEWVLCFRRFPSPFSEKAGFSPLNHIQVA